MSLKDEQITQTAIVKITTPLDVNNSCGMCSVETYPISGEPQFYIAETNEPLCSMCTNEQAPGLSIMVHIFILVREFIKGRTGICDTEADLLSALEELRPRIESHIASIEPRPLKRGNKKTAEDKDERIN
jgi:hypothetical protein